jgi:arylsulfatase A-like enzyme
VTYVDDQLGRLLDALSARRLLDNTVVVVTSDLGEQFGEHGLFDHGNGLYRQVLHVPLVIVFPERVPPGVRISRPVSLVDLPATILEMTGVATAAGSFPGRSMAALWATTTERELPAPPLLAEVKKGINLPPWLPASKGTMQSVVIDGMHYIRNGDGSEELYDFERDPDELVNRADHPESRIVLEKARRAIQSSLSQP